MVDKPLLDGGGVYGPDVRHLQQTTEAEAVIAIIVGGCHGSGCSVVSQHALDGFKVAERLRALADAIESAERENMT